MRTSFIDFIQKRPKVIIAVILLITALFLIPASDVEFDSALRLFATESVVEPLERLEVLLDIPFYGITIVGKDNESMLSLDALKEQLELVHFLQRNFDVDTSSAVEIIEKELQAKYNKSIADIKSEDELSKVIYDLFEQSPENFKKAAQELLVKDYDTRTLDDTHFLNVFSRMIPFSDLFLPETLELPHADISKIYLSQKNRSAGEAERERIAPIIRESVDDIEFEHIRPLHYSYILLTHDVDQKLAGNTILIAVLTVVFMSAIIFASFRRLYFVFIPLAIMTITVIWTFGTAVLLDMKVTSLHTFIIALLVGIALDAPLHITKRFLEQKKKDRLRTALNSTMSSMLLALFLTFITTAAAFLAQIILPSPPALFSFAVVVIIGVTYSFILVCILWPALMAARKHPPHVSSGRRIRKAMDWVFNIGIRHSKIIIILLIAALLLSVYNAGNIETDSSVSMFVPEGTATKEALEVCKEYSPEYIAQFIMIEGNITQPEIMYALDMLEQNIQDNELLEQINNKVKFEGVNTLLRQLNVADTSDLEKTFDELYESNATADPVTKETVADKAGLLLHKNASGYHSMLVLVWIKHTSVEQTIISYRDLLDDIEQSGLYDIKGINTEVTGDFFATALGEWQIRKLQIFSSILMFIFTFLILLLIYRRFFMSIIVSIPIFICSIFSLGLMPLLKMPLTVLNAMVISLIIGLGIDYGIYLAARYKEELKNRTAKEAARIALMQTGDGLWLAAVSTIVGFVIISFSFLPMAKSFGILTAISIALTFLTTIFLLPTLLVRFVKK
ncbi:MMPL family transporter [Candidatus Woesearchaeota archaeon]|nr:MMPL family transporter [Candidatus Woesearchaeota archaeon]